MEEREMVQVRSFPVAGRSVGLLAALGTLAGCSVFTPQEEPQADPKNGSQLPIEHYANRLKLMQMRSHI